MHSFFYNYSSQSPPKSDFKNNIFLNKVHVRINYIIIIILASHIQGNKGSLNI